VKSDLVLISRSIICPNRVCKSFHQTQE